MAHSLTRKTTRGAASRRYRFLLLSFLLVASTRDAAAQAVYAGIPRQRFDYTYSSQRNSEWCWAAAIQMVLNYYGVRISQEDIVARSFGVDPRTGTLPDWPGSFQVISANLNGWSIDEGGSRYMVSSQIGWGAPPPAFLLNEVANQRPVILAYMSTPTSGHAVVATAVSYTPSYSGPIIQSIIVRDPWPSGVNIANNGRVEYPGYMLASHMTTYWIIRVQPF